VGNGLLRVRAIQPLAGALDVQSAMGDALAAISEAADVDLLVLPELATTRYDIRRHLSQAAPQPGDPDVLALQQAAARVRTVVVLGFAEHEGDARLYNSALVIDTDGSIAGIVRKTHLFAGESRVFIPGSVIEPIRTSIGNLGVAICYDIEFPEVARSLALGGAELFVVLSANMHPYTNYHLTYAKARAMENNIPLVVANWVGDGPRFSFLGHSCIVSATGEILADAGSGPGHAEASVLPGRDAVDTDLNYLAQRRPDLYRLHRP
jgi:predicted amidohydrolase